MHAVDFAVLLLVAAVLALAIRSMLRRRKNGSGCCGSCSACTGCMPGKQQKKS